MSDNPAVSAPELSSVQHMIERAGKDQARVFEYDITVVTPMFGGSSEISKVHPKHPIRTASIRGHLRFWWRATRGAACTTVDELRMREVAIFGDTQTPSRVKVWVESGTSSPRLVEAKELNKTGRPVFKRGLPLYALFPFTEKDVEYLDKYNFKLCIRYNEVSSDSTDNPNGILNLQQLQEELNAALWAWINFGGIGSRTRRGCGSLFCLNFSPRMGQPLDKWYREQQQRYKLNLLPLGKFRDWPTLSQELRFVKPDAASRKNQMAAWKDVIDTYHCFRQKRNINDGEVKRSLWPEPDSLRRITKMAMQKHKDLFTLKSEELEYAFPRAQFGLPIITEFKKDHPGEPYKTEIVPEGKNRLSSPLILKVIAHSYSKGTGAIIVLNQRPLTRLSIIRIGKAETPRHHEVESILSSLNLSNEHIYPHLKYVKSPMKDQQNKSTSSAIKAFLASKEVQNWKDGRPNKMPSFNSSNQNHNKR